MRLLALDAASRACSVALLVDDEVNAVNQTLEREHGPMLLRMVDDLLTQSGIELSDLDALAFGCGPGSFTGLRIAAGITQGLAFAANLPVVAVSDLAMLAQAEMLEADAEAVAVCCDARMEEAFAGFYLRGEDGLASPLQQDMLVKPGALALPVTDCDRDLDWHAVGDGWRTFENLVDRLGVRVSASGAGRLPDAAYAIGLARAKFEGGETLEAAQAIPVYLREKVAWQRQ